MVSNVAPVPNQRFQAVFEEASKATGTGFDFLLKTAQRESGLRANAKAPTSSATGLFQFIEQTWLETMKEAGPQLGYGNQAKQISQVGEKYIVPNARHRQDILALRKDPKASALMAGAYAKKNEAILSGRLGRQVSSGELYAAHFLGAQGGGQLIELAQSRPDLKASKVFPEQAKANRNIFYDRGGKARTIREVYDNLVATVPQQKNEVAKAFDLGDRFNAKPSMKVAYDPARMQQASPMADFFSSPAVPSRFSLGYQAQTNGASAPRASRLLGERGSTAGGVEAAQGGRASRYFDTSTPEASRGDEAARRDAAMPLPRRKPVTGDIYGDALNGTLPQARQTSPMAGSPSGAEPRRHGALDLTAFLRGDIFSTGRKV